MPIYAPAEQRPWTPYNPERFITPRLVIVHTNAVDAEDPGPQGTLSWHFQVGQHGNVYQHRDTATRAAANADANNIAVSIETWDGGNPEGNPWNAQQLDALVALIGWCCDTHTIPRFIPNAWDGTGVGFHRMHSEWNNPVHSCPGNTRAAQFYDVLLPRLQTPPTPPEDDMPPAPAIAPDSKGHQWVFVRGATDGALWAKKDNEAWFSLGGVLTSGPSAALLPSGRMAVVVRGSDGAQYQRTLAADGLTWEAWYPLGGAS